jgi:UPF0755 protein
MRRWLLAAVALVAVAGIASTLAVRHALSPATRDAGDVIFQVERGATLRQVARGLEEAGLVRSAAATAWYARLQGLEGHLQAGEYQLSASLSAPAVVGRIARGAVVTYQVVLPEGLRASEVAARLEERGLCDAAAFRRVVGDAAFAASLGVQGETLEGYLFPETYRFPRGMAPEDLARAMVTEFLRVWQEIAPLAEHRGMSMQEVVTLASLVEKETAVPEERPQIAAVFHNRLARRMRLETDPSVIYGIADFDGNLRRRDLEDVTNPYNTYRFAGLPPGPIANPGADALRAVVEPAQSDYLYFVSRNDGTHQFSRTYREHVAAVNRYQRRRASR